METKNAELIQGLRDLLAFVEANQDFEFNPVVGMSNVELKACVWYIHDDERQKKIHEKCLLIKKATDPADQVWIPAKRSKTKNNSNDQKS